MGRDKRADFCRKRETNLFLLGPKKVYWLMILLTSFYFRVFYCISSLKFPPGREIGSK